MKSSTIFFLFAFVSTLSAEVLTFSNAYNMSLQNNNNIKSATYQTDAVKEQVNQEKAALYPKLDFSSYYTKNRYNRRGNNKKDIINQGLINYTFSLKQAVYNPTIYARVNIQESKAKLSYAKLDTSKAKLVQDVFSAYLDILKSNSQIKALQVYTNLTKAKFDALKKKYEMNLVSKVDVLQIKVEYHTAQIKLKKEQQKHDTALLKLKQLIGKGTYTFPKINVQKQISDTIEKMQVYVDNIKGNLQSNLGVKEALISSQLTLQEMNNAYSGHLPKVNINASFSHYNTDTPTIDYSYDSIAKVMLTLDIPIYSGGYVSSQVKSSKLRNQASEEDLIDAKKQAVLKRDEALNKFNTAIQTINMYQETFESAQLYYDAVKESFDRGLKSRVDLNDANSKLYKIKYQYIENISEVVDSYISLLIVTNHFEGIKLLDNLII